jgi:hypothetical protein
MNLIKSNSKVLNSKCFGTWVPFSGSFKTKEYKPNTLIYYTAPIGKSAIFKFENIQKADKHKNYSFATFLPPWHNSPYWTSASSLPRVQDHHTQTHRIRYDSSRGGIGQSQRPLPDKTQLSQETDIHAPAGFEPTIPASERPQAQALDLAGTGTGTVLRY